MEKKFDIFISHATPNKKTAKKACDFLEANGLTCWIAFRDIKGGDKYGISITNALKSSRILVVIYSRYAEDSQFVNMEIERAATYRLTIMPFRIDDTVLTESELFLSSSHWQDATEGMPEDHFQKLLENCIARLKYTQTVPLIEVLDLQKEKEVQKALDVKKEIEYERKYKQFLIPTIIALFLLSILTKYVFFPDTASTTTEEAVAMPIDTILGGAKNPDFDDNAYKPDNNKDSAVIDYKTPQVISTKTRTTPLAQKKNNIASTPPYVGKSNEESNSNKNARMALYDLDAYEFSIGKLIITKDRNGNYGAVDSNYEVVIRFKYKRVAPNETERIVTFTDFNNIKYTFNLDGKLLN